MKICLYGLPSAGKTFIMNHIDFMNVYNGSKLLREIEPRFDVLPEADKAETRRKLAEHLRCEDNVLMDGHYAFGDQVVFTNEDGELYDVFMYLYINPNALCERMVNSSKNSKYAGLDIEAWQTSEIMGLRTYCHEHNKDFYVIDSPETGNVFGDITQVVEFIRAVHKGFSCIRFGYACADAILQSTDDPTIVLTDGDKTLTIEDSSSLAFGYKTHLFDNNFYTGYQSWRQNRDFERVTELCEGNIPIHYRDDILKRMTRSAYILTAGHSKVWKRLAAQLGMKCFSGSEMSAEAKFFAVKRLQAYGRKVIAYGDSMNDYYMLKQADESYLVTKADGTVSSSLKNLDMGGIAYV